MWGFTRKAKAVKDNLIKAENRKLLQAAVGAAMWVSAADGTIDDNEIRKLESVVAKNKKLEVYGSEVQSTVDRFEGLFTESVRSGRLEVRNLLQTISDSRDEAEIVMVLALDVAEASGDIEDDEGKVIDEIASLLKLKVSDYL